MKKKAINAGMIVGLFLGAALVAYAVTNLFFTQNERSTFKKKTIFQFVLSTGEMSGEIGPGDSFSTSPVVYNNATDREKRPEGCPVRVSTICFY